MNAAVFFLLSLFFISCSNPSNRYQVVLANGTVVTAVDEAKRGYKSGDSVSINRVGGSQWIILTPRMATEETEVRPHPEENKNRKQATTFTDRGVIQ